MEYNISFSAAQKIQRSIFVLAVVFTLNACKLESVASGNVATPANDAVTNLPTATISQPATTVHYDQGDNTLFLSWQPNLDPIDGYIVYGGPTPEEVTTELSVTQQTSVQYNTINDLGLSSGDQTCFRLRSYRAESLSAFSEAVCLNIPLS